MARSAAEIPQALAAHASLQSFAAASAVFRIGDRARSVFHLVDGRVRLLRYGRDGEEVIVHQVHAGEFFAEASLHSERYHCSAIAIEACELRVLPAARLKELLATDPAFALQWVEALSRQLRQTRARVERLCLKSARERVRHLLLTEGTGEHSVYSLPGTLKDLATDLALTHEALYRTLASMVREGTLLRDGNRLAFA
jgi:CRP-like cAMP-binding protein